LGVRVSNLTLVLGLEQHEKCLRDLKIFTVLKEATYNSYSSERRSRGVLGRQKFLEVKITDGDACQILELLKQNTLMLGSAFSLCSVKAMQGIITLRSIWKQDTASAGNYGIRTGSVLFSKVRNDHKGTASKRT